MVNTVPILNVDVDLVNQIGDVKPAEVAHSQEFGKAWREEVNEATAEQGLGQVLWAVFERDVRHLKMEIGSYFINGIMGILIKRTGS